MITILDALLGADYNLSNSRVPMQIEIAKSQVHNAAVLLEKGYDADDDITDLISKYNPIETAPEV